MKNGLNATLMLAVLSLAVGCSVKIVPLPPLEATRDYVIQPDDVIDFLLFNPGQQGGGAEPIKLVVQTGGKVMVPYIGAIPAAGRTPDALLRDIRSKFATVFNTPTVPHLSVHVFPSRTIHVLGFVKNVNRYQWRPGMRVTDAIALSGGVLHPFSQPNDSVLLRRDSSGEYQNYQIRFTDITYGEDTTTNALLKPGDMIFVPASGFRRVAFFLEDLLSPLQALFTPIAGPISAVTAP